MALFEGYERRIDQINAVLNSYGISSIEEAEKITKDAGLDVYEQVKIVYDLLYFLCLNDMGIAFNSIIGKVVFFS